MAARVLRAADRRAVPWKNGGGVTSEVAAGPPGSDLASFDWRVSIAHVEMAGPFSVFPGVERRLAVLEGQLELAVGGRPPLVLTPESAPLVFSGETPAAGRPQGARVTDLNVMTRIARCAARLERGAGANAPARVAGHTALLIALTGFEAAVDGAPQQLARLDALLLAPGTSLSFAGREVTADFWWIEIVPPGRNLSLP
ncbi:MAG TPA: HutD family protein [Steroidobacteraceae bacterium]|nr:HutD family protein [Steroidobacteraceae bacterium]